MYVGYLCTVWITLGSSYVQTAGTFCQVCQVIGLTFGQSLSLLLHTRMHHECHVTWICHSLLVIGFCTHNIFFYPMRCQRVNSKMIQYKRMLVVLKLKEMAEIIDAVGSTHLTLRKIAKNFHFFQKNCQWQIF